MGVESEGNGVVTAPASREKVWAWNRRERGRWGQRRGREHGQSVGRGRSVGHGRSVGRGRSVQHGRGRGRHGQE
jgi:hypothetical protein